MSFIETKNFYTQSLRIVTSYPKNYYLFIL